MRIYLKNISDKLYSDPIWNDEVFNLFWTASPQQEQQQQE